MPLANYTTSVDALKTVGEIQGILVGHGARQILLNYDNNGRVTSLSFIVNTPQGELPFRLPANPQAVLNILQKDAPPRYATYEHAVKVAWRIIRDWVRAQMALLETEMVTMHQIFLPYLMIDSSQTLYDRMIESKFQLPQGIRHSGD